MASPDATAEGAGPAAAGPAARARAAPAGHRPGDDVPGPAELLARFVRLFSLGATLLWPLVGLATAAPGGQSPTAWLRMVALGVAFHVVADVGNDVCDLPVDRTDPRRVASPLVRGLVRPTVALLVAVAAVPVAAAALLGTGPRPTIALAVAVALLAAYDVAGKSLRWPVVADLVQGAGWAALVVVGAQVGGGATRATWWAAAFVVAYIALVNGVHGAVRDVASDRRAGARTTAVLLGARVDGRRVTLPRALVVDAVVLQGALTVALVGVVAAAPGAVSVATVVAVAVVHGLATGLLVAAARRRDDLAAAMTAGTWHLFVAPVALLVAAHGLVTWATAATLAVYVVPPWAFGRVVRDSGPVTPPPPTPPPPTPPGADVVRRDRARGLWQLLRVGVPVAAGLLAVVGALLATGDVGALPAAPLAAVVLATVASTAAGNACNDRCDVVADAVNGSDRPLPAGRLAPVDADRLVVVLVAVTVAAVAPLGPAAVVIVGALTAVGLAYSVVLRRWVGVGQVATALLFASPVVVGGVLVAGDVGPRHAIAVGLVATMVFARETLKGVPDRAGDRAAGHRTLATRFGTPVVLRVFRVSAAVLVGASLLAAPRVGTVAYLLGVVVCVVLPTALAVRRVRGAPSVADVAFATDRFGRVFGLGLVPLVALAIA